MLRSQARASIPIGPQPGRKVDFPSRSADYLDEALGPGGHLARSRPGWESRPQQIQLARAIDAAIRDGKHLLAEGSTGVGKSVAYLVPAIHHAIERGRKVVVVTANINLQEQLIRKDLPSLRDALPTPFTFAIAKGRGQWLCREVFNENDPQRDPKWPAVQRWAATTVAGDVSELPFEPGPLRRLFTVSAEDCIGRTCPSFEGCHAEAAKAAYSKADVVVTNYHLWLLDLQIKAGDPTAGPLPPWAIAICDEVHRLPDLARELLGWKVTKGAIDRVASLLAKTSAERDEAEELRAEAADFFDRLLRHARSDRYKARLKADGEVGDVEPLVAMLVSAASTLEREAELEEGKKRHRLRTGASNAQAIALHLVAAAKLQNAERRVYCVEVDPGEGRAQPRAALCCKLIWPADVLRPRLFDAPGRVVIGTSATLAADGSFDYVAHELGCEGARELAVASPFDFARQALLVVPRGCPDPKRRDEHERWVADQTVEVACASRGRMLALFTSYRGMRKAAEAFGPANLDRNGIERTWGTVLVQGDAPRGELLRRFKEETASVLLGTESFWEGVDVPGESLSVVVVDRLPFATPDDPVLDAVDALMPRGAFKEWSLPRAIQSLRQGVGRLVRTKTDRGVIVLLDDRVLTKNYGRGFLRSLPSMPLSRRLEDVGDFLAGKVSS